MNYQDYLYNENYIYVGQYIYVEDIKYKITAVNNFVEVIGKNGSVMKIDLMREFFCDSKNKLTLLPLKKKYKIVYSVAMTGTFEEFIDADTPAQAVNIFRTLSSAHIEKNGNFLKNCEIYCIEVKETFIKKYIV